ncbi:unnamed protein product, partial [Urochloa humidicola]
ESARFFPQIWGVARRPAKLLVGAPPRFAGATAPCSAATRRRHPDNAAGPVRRLLWSFAPRAPCPCSAASSRSVAPFPAGTLLFEQHGAAAASLVPRPRSRAPLPLVPRPRSRALQSAASLVPRPRVVVSDGRIYSFDACCFPGATAKSTASLLPQGRRCCTPSCSQGWMSTWMSSMMHPLAQEDILEKMMVRRRGPTIYVSLLICQ